MAHRSIKGIEETLAMMKRASNLWADKYVLDVGHLLMKLREAHAAGQQAERERIRTAINALGWRSGSITDELLKAIDGVVETGDSQA